MARRLQVLRLKKTISSQYLTTQTRILPTRQKVVKQNNEILVYLVIRECNIPAIFDDSPMGNEISEVRDDAEDPA
ncbi:hypothetical protein B9Z55_014418 [Caenorhabditis nigoni]|uniref:Uncharacterized protein n=1 Tax=Caenorhabditis nigoni TaxID=1611254 RepID=A0A2G5U5W0_9PELO|nr:hypothetical protein B9Z55_014418 [Caenorhabditis nigoni]